MFCPNHFLDDGSPIKYRTRYPARSKIPTKVPLAANAPVLKAVRKVLLSAGEVSVSILTGHSFSVGKFILVNKKCEVQQKSFGSRFAVKPKLLSMPKSKPTKQHKRAGSTRKPGSTLVPEGEDGNNRPSPSVHWNFTLFDYSEADIANILEVGSNGSKILYFQEERGEKSGKEHLQGYIAFKKKCRPIGMFDNKTIDWSKTRFEERGRAYPLKDDTRFGRRWTLLDGKVPTVRRYEKILPDPYPWQKEIIDLCATEPDKRTIHWYWEATGGVGKSTLAKYIVKHYNAIVVSGKAADMKCAIARRVEEVGTAYDVVIMDIPRSIDEKFFSYTGIEEIKNGLFFNGKYESGMVVTEYPHVIVFANRPPDVDKMSADRWHVVEIGK